MNKERAKERLCAIETEVEKLRRIIDEPEARKPEAGDVWVEGDGTYHYISGMSGRLTSSMLNEDADSYTRSFETCPFGDIDDFTYLGKFNEVFVKISDVRDALSHKDIVGNSVMNSKSSVEHSGMKVTREALRKLNIITD